MVSIEALREQFSSYGIDGVSEEVLNKCEDICVANNIDEEELVEIWVAFSVSHLGGANPTLDTLGQMERKEFGKKQDQHPQTHQQSRPQESTLVIYNSKESSIDHDLADDILDAYNSTPKAKSKFGKKIEHTPDSIRVQGRSPRAVFSPASFSPTASTPSSKYNGRTNQGNVVCCNGEFKGKNWRRQQGSEFNAVVKQLLPCMEMKTCYMFNQLRDVANMLDDAMYLLGEGIVSKHSLEDPQRIDIPHQDEFVGIGRVCCDCNGRLNSMSVLLESFDGRTVPLDVSQVETCSLFPGQVIAVKGGNPLGSKLAAKQIYCDTTLPMPEKPSYSSDESEPLQILVAAGPFTQSDTLTYEPLEDLVQYIIDHEPHVVILIGPFVDVSHPQIVEGMLAETFQSCFERIIESFMEPLKLLKVNVVLVPSFRDAHHQMVYPVPPFMLRKQFSNLTLASDPCMLDINGIVIGVTSADVLLNLSKEEIFHGGLKSSDRLGRIASHILHQRNFYPLYPAAEEVNLDVELWGKYCFMHVTPNILILPSDLRCFIKNLNNCVTVNPERLAKGVVGGSFARLEVSCVNGKVSVAAQVVKI